MANIEPDIANLVVKKQRYPTRGCRQSDYSQSDWVSEK